MAKLLKGDLDITPKDNVIKKLLALPNTEKMAIRKVLTEGQEHLTSESLTLQLGKNFKGLMALHPLVIAGKEIPNTLHKNIRQAHPLLQGTLGRRSS